MVALRRPENACILRLAVNTLDSLVTRGLARSSSLLGATFVSRVDTTYEALVRCGVCKGKVPVSQVRGGYFPNPSESGDVVIEDKCPICGAQLVIEL